MAGRRVPIMVVDVQVLAEQLYVRSPSLSMSLSSARGPFISQSKHTTLRESGQISTRFGSQNTCLVVTLPLCPHHFPRLLYCTQGERNQSILQSAITRRSYQYPIQHLPAHHRIFVYSRNAIKLRLDKLFQVPGLLDLATMLFIL